jgi:hypothetical protein
MIVNPVYLFHIFLVSTPRFDVACASMPAKSQLVVHFFTFLYSLFGGPSRRLARPFGILIHPAERVPIFEPRSCVHPYPRAVILHFIGVYVVYIHLRSSHDTLLFSHHVHLCPNLMTPRKVRLLLVGSADSGSLLFRF